MKSTSRLCVQLAGACMFCFALVSGCAQRETAGTSQCAPKPWSGLCELRAAQKIEERELPIPHVVFEAVYLPQVSQASPEYSPPEKHERVWVAAQYETDLLKHLEQHRVVQCYLPQAQGTCIPTELAVNVPPFDPAKADAAREKPKAPGCGQIESTQDQERLAQRPESKTVISDRILFDQNSAGLSPEATALAQQIAARIKSDAALECVAVVGQASAGENPSLPEERARAVKELLVSLGVERHRLMTITLTASVYGAGARPGEADPTQRRVSIKVLLEKTPTP